MAGVAVPDLTGMKVLWALPPRDPGEEHRASTPLELLFDLCFVVGVGQAAARLHHSVGEGQVGHGLVGYLSVFFAIWWAWMNFSWFASAYDQDDVLYRLLTLVQMAGVLILATGVDAAFEEKDFTRVTIGYVVMRVAMIVQWLRAARGDPSRRTIALRYAGGLAVVQVGWVARLALPLHGAEAAFLVLVLAEIVVPLWAERAGPMTPWHPEHIAERYGEFTLIVLGESVLATMIAAKELPVSWSTTAAGVGACCCCSASGGRTSTRRATRSWSQRAHDLGLGLWAPADLRRGRGARRRAVGRGRGAGPRAHLSDAGAAYAVAVPVSVFYLRPDRAARAHRGGVQPAPAELVKALGVLLVAALAWWLPLGWVVLLLGLYEAVGLADHTIAGRRAARRRGLRR